jgi:hypothetical protein
LTEPQQRRKGNPILFGFIYRGAYPHLRLNAGGSDLAQLKVALKGAVTTSGKHTIIRSENTTVCSIAITWDRLPFQQPAENERKSEKPATTESQQASSRGFSRLFRRSELSRCVHMVFAFLGASWTRLLGILLRCCLHVMDSTLFFFRDSLGTISLDFLPFFLLMLFSTFSC